MHAENEAGIEPKRFMKCLGLSKLQNVIFAVDFFHSRNSPSPPVSLQASGITNEFSGEDECSFQPLFSWAWAVLRQSCGCGRLNVPQLKIHLRMNQLYSTYNSRKVKRIALAYQSHTLEMRKSLRPPVKDAIILKEARLILKNTHFPTFFI